jgi:hypothetical protein
MKFYPLQEDEEKKPLRFYPIESPPPPAAAPAPIPARGISDQMVDDLGGILNPAVEAPAPKAKKAPAPPPPYKNRLEALDDAVNLLEEGQPFDRVVQSFSGIGIGEGDIIAHGRSRKSPYFAGALTNRRAIEQYTKPEDKPFEPPKNSGSIRPVETSRGEEAMNIVRRGMTQASQTVDGLAFSAGLIDNAGMAELVRKRQREIGKYGPTGDIAAGLERLAAANESGDWGAVASEVVKPENWKALGSIVFESVVASSPQIAALVAGSAVAGPAGAAAAAGASSLAMEFGAAFGETLDKRGVDTSDPVAVRRVLEDPKFQGEVTERGLKRGVPIAVMDAVSAGVAGRFIKAVEGAAQAGKYAQGGARRAFAGAAALEAGTQIGTGMGGEAIAQAMVGESKPLDVLVEGLAEVPSGAVEVASNVASARNVSPAAQIAAEIDRAAEGIGGGLISSRMAEPPGPSAEDIVSRGWGARETSFTPPDSLIAQAGITPVKVPMPGVTEDDIKTVEAEFGLDALRGSNVRVPDVPGSDVGGGGAGGGAVAAGGLADAGPVPAVDGRGGGDPAGAVAPGAAAQPTRGGASPDAVAKEAQESLETARRQVAAAQTIGDPDTIQIAQRRLTKAEAAASATQQTTTYGQTTTTVSAPDVRIDWTPGQSTNAQRVAEVTRQFAGYARANPRLADQLPQDLRPVSAEVASTFDAISDSVAEALGTSRAVLVESDKMPDGINFAGVSLVNVKGLQKPAVFVAVHENVHQLQDLAERGRRPGASPEERAAAEIWAPMEETIWSMIPEAARAKYAERALGMDGGLYEEVDEATGQKVQKRRPTGQEFLATPEGQRTVRREMLADFSARRLTEPETVNELARRNPAAFGGFARKMVDYLSKTIKALRGNRRGLGPNDVDRHIADLQKAKAVWQDAMLKWAARGGAKAQPAQGSTPSRSGRVDTARLPGESDKQFAKRVIDKRPAPESLPETYESYFLMDGAKVVPMSSLVSSKTDAENEKGGTNAVKRMAAAAAGELPRRAPITVMPSKTPGKYDIVDGNGTFTSVGKYGWKSLPVLVISREDGTRQIKIDKAADAAEPFVGKKLVGEMVDAIKGTKDEPKKQRDAEKLREAQAFMAPLIERAKEVNDEFAGRVRALAKRLGADPSIGPVKTNERAAEKYYDDVFDDGATPGPDVVKDLVRASLIVKDEADVETTIAALREEFDVIRLKDRFAKPLPTGYRDVLLNVRLENGAIGEIQIHLPGIYAAKELGHLVYNVERQQTKGSELQVKLEDLQTRYYGAAYDSRLANSSSETNAPDRMARIDSKGLPDRAYTNRAGEDSVAGMSRTATPSTSSNLAPDLAASARQSNASSMGNSNAGQTTGNDPIVNQGSLYVSRPLLDAQKLHDWAVKAGIQNVVPPSKMHATVVYSRAPLAYEQLGAAPANVSAITKRLMRLGEDNDIVITLSAPALEARHKQALEEGASWDHDRGYIPHVTLSYSDTTTDITKLTAPNMPVRFGPEKPAPLRDGWATEEGLTPSKSVRLDEDDLLRRRRNDGKPIVDSVVRDLGLTEEELASTSLPLMTGLTKGEAFATNEVGKIPEVVSYLEERRRASGLRPLDLVNEADRAILAKLVAAEALAAIRSAGSAVEWYDSTIRRTLNTMALKHPELASDQRARDAFLIATAITSQGMNVENNLEAASQQYEAFRRDGRFPVRGWGDSMAVMEKNFALANSLLDELGPDLLGRFLRTPFTVQELNRAGFSVDGELADEMVLGSSVFGPKIGFGFFSNLAGNFEPVTMDMWFMRTIGRLTGNLRAFEENKFAKQLAGFRAAFEERGESGIFADQFDEALVQRAMGDVDAAVELARKVTKAHEKDFKTNRKLYDEKARTKSKLVNAAATIIQSMDKPRDVPASGGERRLLRDVVRQAVGLVARSNGSRVPPAAMQALIWYPEQELYKALGVRLAVTSQDYAGAAEKVLKEQGYGQDEIRAAAEGRLPGGARRMAGAADAGVDEAAGQEPQGPRPLEGRERREFLHARVVAETRRSLAAAPLYREGSGGGQKPWVDVGGSRTRPTRTFKIASRANINALQAVGISTPEIHEVDRPDLFALAIQGSKANNPSAASVYVYPVEEYSAMRLFLTSSGKSGFAIKPDGDIVSVFNYDPDNKGVVHAMLPLAVQLGGRKLDAFDTVLPKLYGMHGFRAVARLPWNDEFSPEGWNKQDYRAYNNGEPDVVFMVHDPENFIQYRPGDGQRVDDYDAAVAAQAPSMSRRLEDDLRAQEQFLNERAREAGYRDLEEFVDRDYAGFVRAAEQWRAENPAEDWEPEPVSYSRRTKPDPVNTVTAYKLFRVDARRPGQLFPLFVNANDPVEMGVWLDADVGPAAAGGKVKSKLGPLAFRPGWHAGDVPIATHIGEKSSPEAKAPDTRPANHVWAEVEMAADRDWQTEANRRGTNKAGRIVPVKAHITDQIPEDGFYRYKTNANMTGNWLIGGSMKVTRVLSDAEVKAINDEAGVADLPRAEPFDPEAFGFPSMSARTPLVSPASILNAAVTQAADSLEAVLASGRPKKLALGRTPHVLSMLGAQPRALEMDEAIVRKVFFEKHFGKLDGVDPREVVVGLYRPAAIFKKPGTPNEYELLLPVPAQGGPLFAVIGVDSQRAFVKSIYPRSWIRPESGPSVKKFFGDRAVLSKPVYVDEYLIAAAATGNGEARAETGFRIGAGSPSDQRPGISSLVASARPLRPAQTPVGSGNNSIARPGSAVNRQHFISMTELAPLLKKAEGAKSEADLKAWIGENYDGRAGDGPSFSARSGLVPLDDDAPEHELLQEDGRTPESMPDLVASWSRGDRVFVAHEQDDGASEVADWSVIESGGYTLDRIMVLPREAFGISASFSARTDTPEFKRWFGDSKVVDGEGKPLVVYHGTNKSFDKFKVDSELGAHFGTLEQANSIAKWKSDAVMMPAYLSIKNPLRLQDVGGFANSDVFPQLKELGLLPADWKFAYPMSVSAARDAIIAAGYDGVVYLNRHEVENFPEDKSVRRMSDAEALEILPDARDSFIAFRPEQIKSAIGNRGTFDPADPDISRSARTGSGWRDAAGRLQFAPGAAAYRVVAGLANRALEKVKMKPISPELGRAIRKMKVEIERAQNLSIDVSEKLGALSDDERRMISDVIERELKAGVTPPKRILAAAASISRIMSEQTQELIRLGMLDKDTAARLDGKYLPRFYEKDLGDEAKSWAKAAKRLLSRPGSMQGIRGNSLKARGIFKDVPLSELQDWVDQGWEERDPNRGPADETVRVWRDFTPEEREQMGEIRDASFRFVMGYMRSQKDIALGRLYESLARDVAQKKQPLTGNWVQVPQSPVGDGVLVRRYGKLSGMWVPVEVMDHLSVQDRSFDNELLQAYRKGLSMWKEGKTVLNPVSHVNNVISNIISSHFAGVSMWEAHKYAGAIRDLVKSAPMVQEASDAGLFGGTFSSEELTRNLPDKLKILAQQQESALSRGADKTWTALSLFLRKPAGIAYEAEDKFFRYLIYRDARKRGLNPDEAVEFAQTYVFTYDDLPQGARVIRDTALPFFSYTYKAIPMLAETALKYPWRYAFPAALVYGANAAAYAIAAGADEDDLEDIVRKYFTDEEFRAKAREIEKSEEESLPPWMQGYGMTLGVKKTIRLGMDETTDLPVFLEVQRWIPGGDIFDITANAGGLPLPAPITPSNPLLTLFTGLIGNKDLFTGRDLVDKKADTDAEAGFIRAHWAWRQITPAVAPMNYHWDRALQTIAHATGEPITFGPLDYTGTGRDGLPAQVSYSVMQTVGVKARPVDLELSADFKSSDTRATIARIDAEMRRVRKLLNKGAKSEAAAEKELELLRTKKDRLRDGLDVDGDPRP